MNTIRISKELLINLGNFSNIKIVAEITSDSTFEEAWRELNKQIADQESIERATRLTPKIEPKEEVIF